MDLKEQDRSARKKHKKIAKGSGKTCIDCHKGVAHEIPKEPDA
jgi:cytochrome c-type protein NapC